jgi:class 3 adenylate cyclase/tetratricopeptide (TPR) repeat protein
MRCQDCYADNPAGQVVCVACAATLRPRCGRCGFENPARSRFCPQCANPVEPVDVGGGGIERRQLTVVFCDLVGATAIARRLGLEDWHATIKEYHAVCNRVVGERGGHVAQHLGDGVLAYFGYPVSFDDSARRAVQAGLALVGAIGALGRRRAMDFFVRVGVHTGLTVVDSIGDRPERLALGDTPNLAARVQEAAEAGTVLVTEATFRLTRGFFNCTSAGKRALKGVAEPLELYRVMGESGADTRLEASALAGLSPLVGRAEERARVSRAWAATRGGEGRTVLLVGEAGIGKSRHIAELEAASASEPRTLLEGWCAPQHQATPLYPIIDLIERRLGLRHAASDQQRYALIERELAGGSADSVRLFAWLLGVPLPQGQPPLEMPPLQRRQAAFEAVISWLCGFVRQQPTLLVLEDLHWCDPSTLDLVGMLCTRASGLPLLVLLTARPEFEAPWGDGFLRDTIVLGRLPREDMTTLVAGLTGHKRLPPALMTPLLARADGVPLFLEEMTKAVLESGLVRETDDGFEAVGQVTAEDIPATLRDSLMARLDRLDSAKPIAQVAAVLGREFDQRVLEVVAAVPVSTLASGLQRLVDSQLLYRSGDADTYTFKHALIQEAAYDSLLGTKKKEYHLRVAAALAGRFSELVVNRPELLAHHYAAGGRPREAVTHWHQAGQRAIESSAHAEAIGHFGSALEQLALWPRSADRSKQEMELRGGLGLALLTTKGFAAREVEETYRRAAELCEEIGDELPLRVLYGTWAVNIVRADAGPVERLVRRYRALERASVPQTAFVAKASLQTWAFWRGDYADSLAFGLGAVAHCDGATAKAQHEALMRDAGFEGFFYPALYGAWAHILLGRTHEGLALWDRAVQMAAAVSDPYATAGVQGVGTSIMYLLGDRAAARTLAEALRTVATDKGYLYFQAAAMIPHGWATVLDTTDAERGLEEMHAGLGILRAMGAMLLYPFFLSYLVEAYLHLGRLPDAASTCREALTMTRAGEFRHGEPNLLRLTSEILERQGDPLGAQHHLEEAIAISRRQGARFVEVQVAMSLARLQAHRGAAAEARTVLGQALRGLEEPAGTATLDSARHLLARL